MSTIFRIDSVALQTSGGPVAYSLDGPLTVLDGPVGTGKSTLFELIKHALGGKARFSPVVIDHVSSVELEVTAGTRRFFLRRSTSERSDQVFVRDLIAREDIGLVPVEDPRNKAETTLGKILLVSLGLPENVRASAMGARGTSKPGLVTFNDVWASLYVEQPEIDRSIAHHSDSYREPKRRTVFELFFGLTDQNLLSLKADLQTAEQELSSAEREESVILQFLRDAGTESREDVMVAQEQARDALERGKNRLRQLNEESDPADAHTDVLRDLLVTTQDRVDDLRRELLELERLHNERMTLAAGIRQDLARLQRARDAGQRLADIEFVVCPRCSQSIQKREVPHGACRLCLQPDQTFGAGEGESYEMRQILAQQAEVEELVTAGAEHASVLRTRLAETEAHAKRLAHTVDDRTRELVSPRLQAFADASSAIGTCEERLRALEERLRLWDRASDVSQIANNARIRRNTLFDDVKQREAAQEEQREELLSVMTADFAHTLERLGVPGVRSVRIDSRTYLPYVDGVRFDRISTGGIRTALIVAYWVTLLTTALRDPSYSMPGCLILDSPRKSIGSGEALATNLYRQLDILAETYRDRVQVIVADNRLPEEYARRWQQLKFDYPSPVISVIPHPGPAEVVTLDRTYEQQFAA